MKISIIGAGNVGATVAQRIIENSLGEVVLLDVIKNLAQGKALDLLHSMPIIGCDRKITGTDDYKDIKYSDIVVITAGFPRQPGMSRADLAAKNYDIVKNVVKKIKDSAGDAIIIVVTNPLDLMTYVAYKEGGFKRHRVMGMAGLLDTSRFRYIIAKELGAPYNEVETMVLGEHSPQMVPIISHTKVSGRLIRELMPKERIEKLVERLLESGTEVVELLGKSSAYYAPSAAVCFMIKMIIDEKKEVVAASCIPDGEYGISGVSIGLPVVLGKDGITKIAKLKLDAGEEEQLKKSAEEIKRMLSEL